MNRVDGWTVDSVPLLAPADGVDSEQCGFEDPRVVWLPELERWSIACTAYGPPGPTVYLALTADFRTVARSRSPAPAGRWLSRGWTASSAGACPSRTSRGAPGGGGARAGSASARCSSHRARLADRLPRRRRHRFGALATASASPGPTSKSRRASGIDSLAGSSARTPTTNAPAMSRTASPRAA
jgi:hypothetical protein